MPPKTPVASYIFNTPLVRRETESVMGTLFFFRLRNKEKFRYMQFACVPRSKRCLLSSQMILVCFLFFFVFCWSTCPCKKPFAFAKSTAITARRKQQHTHLNSQTKQSKSAAYFVALGMPNMCPPFRSSFSGWHTNHFAEYRMSSGEP